MNMPDHIQRELIAAGDLTPDRVTAKPQLRTCPTCGARCLVAVPFLLHGATWVDATPTTTYGELVALTTGRRTWKTWTVTPTAMEHRSVESITNTSADESGRVHVTHSCRTIPPAHPAPKETFRAKNESSSPFAHYPAAPPF